MTQMPQLPDQQPDLHGGEKGWKKRLRHLPHLVGLVLMVAAILVVQHEVRHLKMTDIRQAMEAIPAFQLWAAVGCTLLSYFILSFYDRLAAIQVGYGQCLSAGRRLQLSAPMCCRITLVFRQFRGGGPVPAVP